MIYDAIGLYSVISVEGSTGVGILHTVDASVQLVAMYHKSKGALAHIFRFILVLITVCYISGQE